MSFSDAWVLGYSFGKYPDIHNIIINGALNIHWVLAALVCAVVAYLFGSLNSGLLISRIYGTDIRKHGSGNAGATNMTRTFGKKIGALTLICDLVKTISGLFLCRMIFGTEGVLIGAIFCILGHAYPLYFKFKGGKGVVCIASSLLFIDPLVFAIMLLIFIIILFGFKMVSLASVMCMIIYPYMLFQFNGAGVHIIYAMLASFLVIFLHRKNIVRIFNNTESKIFSKKNKDIEEIEDEER